MLSSSVTNAGKGYACKENRRQRLNNCLLIFSGHNYSQASWSTILRAFLILTTGAGSRGTACRNEPKRNTVFSMFSTAATVHKPVVAPFLAFSSPENSAGSRGTACRKRTEMGYCSSMFSTATTTPDVTRRACRRQVAA